MSDADSALNVRDCADKTFDALLPVWADGLKRAEDGKSRDAWLRGWLYADFWKAGNTLDSAINYFVTTGRTNTAMSPATLIQKSHDFIFDTDSHQWGKGPWRDDYGWWGNAFANAVKYAGKLGLSDSLKTTCLKAAKTCWQILVNSAKENESYGSKLPEVKKVAGARYCPWNQDGAKEYFENRREEFKPTPNTVTGCVFFSLSLALYELHAPRDFAGLPGLADLVEGLRNDKRDDR